ncbi:MAG: beta-N-acetylhexosaminidase [Deltaproteobacteria bacterium]|nr:MAG: beta-N-acetylhexosaminidase [Deltaproteobacteria bacterium]
MSGRLFNEVARLFVAGFAGEELDARVRGLLGQGLGGVILFSRNLAHWRAALSLIEEVYRATPSHPPLVTIDQEGGRVQRLGPPFLQLPPMRRLGRSGDESLCRQAAHRLGLELRAAGIWLDFAPVLDVDSNPRNPVIGDRSFSADPLQVARLGVAFGSGLQQAGVAACGKHLPGHGDSSTDSHRELPRLEHDRQRLERVELVPFVRASDHLATMMMAHLLVPALDAELPTSLSPAAYRLARDHLGFGGVIFTDDVEMAAVAEEPGPVEAAVRAIAAGADVVLVCHRPELVEEAIAETVRRVETGAVFRARITEANRRLDGLARRFHAHRARPDGARLQRLFSSPERRELERRLQDTEAVIT